MLRPFTGEEVGPVGGAGDTFTVGSTDVELLRDTAFAETGMFFERTFPLVILIVILIVILLLIPYRQSITIRSKIKNTNVLE